jgi:hypothetical protein
MGVGGNTDLEEVRENVVRINSNLEKCELCGMVASQIVHHSCDEGTESGGYRCAESRKELAAEDTKPLDEMVLVLSHGTASGAYAYHEPDSDGSPICGGGFADVAAFNQLTRRDAKKEGRSPCQNCLRIIES